ncbi:hypothetical protein THAR02_04337 [Trichoderma harzianum]|uniref:Uncharacterized protein n=1 Tax=Trichoderma harzianum TaxID=5544 RepID=A0A0F9XG83_TRIHA|nr:hypothetical protein THAR02_04337 [Trichoderma harzianum]
MFVCSVQKPLTSNAIGDSTYKLPSNRITKNAVKRDTGPNWVDLWFLRIMFGPHLCSKQPWYKDLAIKFPDLDTAGPSGVVPSNTPQILKGGDTTWEPTFVTEFPVELDENTPSTNKRKDGASDDAPSSSKQPKNSTTTRRRENHPIEPDRGWYNAMELPSNWRTTDNSQGLCLGAVLLQLVDPLALAGNCLSQNYVQLLFRFQLRFQSLYLLMDVVTTVAKNLK